MNNRCQIPLLVWQVLFTDCWTSCSSSAPTPTPARRWPSVVSWRTTWGTGARGPWWPASTPGPAASSGPPSRRSGSTSWIVRTRKKVSLGFCWSSIQERPCIIVLRSALHEKAFKILVVTQNRPHSLSGRSLNLMEWEERGEGRLHLVLGPVKLWNVEITQETPL